MPQYRLGEQDVPGPISLNQIRLLKQQEIPCEILQYIFPSINCCHLSVLDDIDDNLTTFHLCPVL